MVDTILAFPVAGTRSVILVAGTVRGMGRECDCEMVALRESDPLTRRITFTRCSVIATDVDLPDGDYTVTFRDGKARVRREGGLWLADGVWLEDAA